MLAFVGIWRVPGVGDEARVDTSAERLAAHRHVGLQRAHDVHRWRRNHPG